MSNKLTIGIGIGVTAFLIWEFLLPREWKAEIKRQFRIHHGELGVVATLWGLLTKNTKVVGMGMGLMLTDLKDKDMWFNDASQNGFIC